MKYTIALFSLLSALCSSLYALSPLPIREFDYHIPANNVSPVTIGMGGLNVAYSGTFFDSYDNPALLADNDNTSLAMSFRLKNSSEMDFYEALSISNALKDKQLKYISLITRNAAWSYQPVSSINISKLEGDKNQYYDYQLDKWQISYSGRDKEYRAITAGLNLKYLNGRLVRLSQIRQSNTWIVDPNEGFIDEKVNGFSSDLGLSVKQDAFTWGASFYDLFSRLYWENYDSDQLDRRAAMGFEYKRNNLSLLAGLQGRIAKEAETTFHFGLVQDWNWEGRSSLSDNPVTQNLILRLGMYSDKFNGTQNITYTLGSGYYYNLFRFDFALSNQGMRLKDSEYIFSLGVGL